MTVPFLLLHVLNIWDPCLCESLFPSVLFKIPIARVCVLLASPGPCHTCPGLCRIHLQHPRPSLTGFTMRSPLQVVLVLQLSQDSRFIEPTVCRLPCWRFSVLRCYLNSFIRVENVAQCVDCWPRVHKGLDSFPSSV